jgi:hypothetical protein
LTAFWRGLVFDRSIFPSEIFSTRARLLEKGKLRATVMSAVRAAPEKSKKLG